MVNSVFGACSQRLASILLKITFNRLSGLDRFAASFPEARRVISGNLIFPAFVGF